MQTQREGWVPLIEYAVRKGVSLSTLRRYIKSKKIEYRLENGKYFVLDEPDALPLFQQAGTLFQKPEVSVLSGQLTPEDRIEYLEEELKKAHIENAELKTLVALYEERS